MTKISIIVPVYNVVDYLEQCVDSLCAAASKNAYEIILVDDGSTDGSGELCDSYADAIPSVMAVHQAHAGLSAARNRGIRWANGTYVMFVDADDYLNQNALQKLVHRITDGADLYFLMMQKLYPNGAVKICDKMEDSHLKGQGKDACIRYLAGLAKFPGSACAKLVKRKLLLLHGLFFEEGVTSEDLVWTLKCILNANTFRYLDGPFYYYRQLRTGSITSRITERSIHDLSHAVQSGLLLAQQEPFRRYRQEICSMMAYEAQVLLLLYGGVKGKARDMCYRMVKKGCRLLPYSNGLQAVGIRWLIRIFGIRQGSRILYGVWKLNG